MSDNLQEAHYAERFEHCCHCGLISKQVICPRCGRERDSGIIPFDSPLRAARVSLLEDPKEAEK